MSDVEGDAAVAKPSKPSRKPRTVTTTEGDIAEKVDAAAAEKVEASVHTAAEEAQNIDASKAPPVDHFQARALPGLSGGGPVPAAVLKSIAAAKSGEGEEETPTPKRSSVPVGGMAMPGMAAIAAGIKERTSKPAGTASLPPPLPTSAADPTPSSSTSAPKADKPDKVEPSDKTEMPAEPSVPIVPGKHTYDALKLPGSTLTSTDIDTTQREGYLSDAEFESVLGKTREEFAKQPKWRRDAIKREKGLF